MSPHTVTAILQWRKICQHWAVCSITHLTFLMLNFLIQEWAGMLPTVLNTWVLNCLQIITNWKQQSMAANVQAQADLRVMPATNMTWMPILVASSLLLACMCYLYFMFIIDLGRVDQGFGARWLGARWPWGEMTCYRLESRDLTRVPALTQK